MVSDVPRTRPAYPESFRREAIELMRQGRTPSELADSLGVSAQTLRNWRRQDQFDRHERDDGVTTDERAELARLRRENQRLVRSAIRSSEPRPSSRRRMGPGGYYRIVLARRAASAKASWCRASACSA